MQVFATKEASIVRLSFFRNALAKDYLLKFKDVYERAKSGLLRLFSFFFLFLINFFRLASGGLTKFVPRVMISNVRLGFTMVRVYGINTSFIWRVAIVKGRSGHIFGISRGFFWPYSNVGVRIINQLVRGGGIQITGRYLYGGCFSFYNAQRIYRLYMIVLNQGSGAIWRNNDVKFNVPTIRIYGFYFGFANTSAVLVKGVFFRMSNVFFFRSIVRAFVSRSGHIRCNVLVVLRIILLRRERALSQYSSGIATN